MNMKKAIALTTALISVASVMSGCGAKEGTAKSDVVTGIPVQTQEATSATPYTPDDSSSGDNVEDTDNSEIVDESPEIVDDTSSVVEEDNLDEVDTRVEDWEFIDESLSAKDILTMSYMAISNTTSYKWIVDKGHSSWNDSSYEDVLLSTDKKISITAAPDSIFGNVIGTDTNSFYIEPSDITNTVGIRYLNNNSTWYYELLDGPAPSVGEYGVSLLPSLNAYEFDSADISYENDVYTITIPYKAGAGAFQTVDDDIEYMISHNNCIADTVEYDVTGGTAVFVISPRTYLPRSAEISDIHCDISGLQSRFGETDLEGTIDMSYSYSFSAWNEVPSVNRMEYIAETAIPWEG